MTSSPPHSGFKKLALLFGSALLALCALEVAMRFSGLGRGVTPEARYAHEDAEQRASWLDRFEAGKRTLLTTGHDYHPRLGWVPSPNLSGARSIGSAPVSTNSRGMRGRAEYTDEKPADTLRVVCIGDSFTFGNDSKGRDTWPVLLESLLDEQLGATEVLNLGVSGYGVDQVVLMLEERGLAFSPDVVVWTLFQGDLERSMHTFTYAQKPKFVLRSGELELTGVPVPTPEELGSVPPPPARSAPWSLTWSLLSERLAGAEEASWYALNRALVERVQTRVEAAGAELIVVALGSDRPQPDREYHRAVLRWGGELDLRLIDVEDLWPLVPGHAFQPAGHLSVDGNTAMAQGLAAAILKRRRPPELGL